MEEEHCSISTQTRDHEFITAEIVIQYSVIPKKAKDAIYKLVHEDFDGLMRSFLTGPVCTFLNRLNLDEVFGRKDEMTQSVREQLSDYVRGYGFAIHRMEAGLSPIMFSQRSFLSSANWQVIELKVCPEVMHAMNEAHKQRRARETAELAMVNEAAQRVQEAGSKLKRAYAGAQSKYRGHTKVIRGYIIHGVWDTQNVSSHYGCSCKTKPRKSLQQALCHADLMPADKA